MIELKHLCRSYPMGSETVNALQDFTLDIEAGDYLSIIGPSGSGKSTLLNQLGLLDSPNSGEYCLDGTATTELNEAEKARFRNDNIGFVFQAYHLINRLTALENVELPLILKGIPASQRREKASELLKTLGLKDFLNRKPQQLSGGQRQRVAIARAVVTQPKILLADEPTGNLDRASGQEVINLLETLNSQGITLVVVTHDSDLGARAKRQITMVDGQLLEIKKRG
ncbi:Macrolide export ATP-binding/permease protein MacB [Marinobacterium sp. xm-g-59]|uniref:ABC transporter ATP-binding protein n=1 Tax=Marinobacterium sp. xm-g-59 TaxID=2497748 RepID=UPI00156950F8|nr:ABC transporter ATP-binding protein [Marinobacterium sp. xm-g-59]NRP95563.1 Macrolide export ATP-binding/permease protein MacB [Marinobacterium sp. xm-g-59]